MGLINKLLNLQSKMQESVESLQSIVADKISSLQESIYGFSYNSSSDELAASAMTNMDDEEDCGNEEMCEDNAADVDCNEDEDYEDEEED